MKPPAPPRVGSHYDYWMQRPPVLSLRCMWWQLRILQGWRPNRRCCAMGYDERAEFRGVYLWESLHVIDPLLRECEANDRQ